VTSTGGGDGRRGALRAAGSAVSRSHSQPNSSFVPGTRWRDRWARSHRRGSVEAACKPARHCWLTFEPAHSVELNDRVGPRPTVRLDRPAEILVVGQAPDRKVHELGGEANISSAGWACRRFRIGGRGSRARNPFLSGCRQSWGSASRGVVHVTGGPVCISAGESGRRLAVSLRTAS